MIFLIDSPFENARASGAFTRNSILIGVTGSLVVYSGVSLFIYDLCQGAFVISNVQSRLQTAWNCEVYDATEIRNRQKSTGIAGIRNSVFDMLRLEAHFFSTVLLTKCQEFLSTKCIPVEVE